MGENGSSAREGFRFDAVHVEQNGVVILDELTLCIPHGGVTVIAGPSGAGKSTMLRLCNRLEVPTTGVVQLDGTDIATIPPTELRRRVGMVFQRPVTFGGTVLENLRVASATVESHDGEHLLRRVALDPAFLDRQADELSGGEAQRMCLARALLADPELVLMDEPTSALDPDNTRQIEELARMLAAQDVPVIWVTHDLEQIRRIADRTIVLIGGRIADPTDAERYLAGTTRGEQP